MNLEVLGVRLATVGHSLLKDKCVSPGIKRDKGGCLARWTVEDLLRKLELKYVFVTGLPKVVSF